MRGLGVQVVLKLAMQYRHSLIGGGLNNPDMMPEVVPGFGVLRAHCLAIAFIVPPLMAAAMTLSVTNRSK